MGNQKILNQLKIEKLATKNLLVFESQLNSNQLRNWSNYLTKDLKKFLSDLKFQTIDFRVHV